MPIHTIGDSHSYFGWNDDIINHHLGPLLCYTFGRKCISKFKKFDIKKFNIKDGDTIIFCLGEIDCRCHIHKHITDIITYQHIINDIVNRYFKTIQLNISILNIKLKNVCVYNIVPPIQRHNTIENNEFPYVGTDEERKQYVLYFNEKLKEKCIEYNYIFFDIYEKYVDENGFLNKKLSDDNVHINNGIHINNFIKEHNL
jgi:lysophospholipase L1-like esterase